MDCKSYLIFKLNQYRYGLETAAVQEIFFLPEVTPVEEAPPDIVGVLNLRGNILPVMDLSVRFGHRAIQYQITDSVIVLEWLGVRVGIIVTAVDEVREIETLLIQKQISYGRKIITQAHHFVAGFAKINPDIVTLLDPHHLVEYSETVDPLIPPEDKSKPSLRRNSNHQPELENAVSGTKSQEKHKQKTADATPESDRSHLEPARYFCPEATTEERAIFRERAASLISASDRQDTTGLMSLAVVTLNGEYFGLDLSLVREFTDIRQITPIPCCEDYILGNMNLRGEIVTLVDIRQLLNLPATGVHKEAKAMVVHCKEIVAGITIDRVCDVIYLHPSQIKPSPSSGHSTSNGYLRGTAPYREKILGLIDFNKMITEGELVVHQEV